MNIIIVGIAIELFVVTVIFNVRRTDHCGRVPLGPTVRLKACTHCRRKRPLSQKSATVAEFGDCRRFLAVFCDSRRFR